MELQHRSSETPTYNDDGTLASISYSGAAVGDLGYTWDANKNKTSESIGGVMSGYGFTAGYDAEDRLTSWDRADTSLDQSWELSPVGDWNSIAENASVQNRTHGPVHEILTAAGQAVQHDPKGNMTQIPSSLRPTASPLALTWDFDNKLKAADTDNDGIDNVFYRWDALGRRVGRDDGTTHVIYFQDGQQTLADYPAGGAASSPAYTYVYGSYIDEVVLRNEGGGTRYYHRNQQYSIIALTDVGGAIVERYAYTAYGQVTFTNASGTVQAASASNNRYTYTGREWDAGLSLYHYRARMYDAVAGRFLSRDPVGFGGSKWNLFEYVGSAPVHKRDPSGKVPIQCECELSDIDAPSGITREATTECGGVASDCCRNACGAPWRFTGNWEIVGQQPDNTGALMDTCPGNWSDGTDYLTCVACCVKNYKFWDSIAIGTGVAGIRTPKGHVKPGQYPDQTWLYGPRRCLPRWCRPRLWQVRLVGRYSGILFIVEGCYDAVAEATCAAYCAGR